MEYYLAIKKNEFIKFLGKWMCLEGIILSEVTQSQKNSHDMFLDSVYDDFTEYFCIDIHKGNWYEVLFLC